MSADKNPSIFSRQMEAIVYISSLTLSIVKQLKVKTVNEKLSSIRRI